MSDLLSQCRKLSNGDVEVPKRLIPELFREAVARINERDARLAELEKRLNAIASTIEYVDERCMAADGPVTPTRIAMTDKEMRAIYKHARGGGR